MSEHPVIACYRGLDSVDAVGLGALLARALGEPLVLASAYRCDPGALSAQALPALDNQRRAKAAGAALLRARRFAGPGIDVGGRARRADHRRAPSSRPRPTRACSSSGATRGGTSRAR